MLDAFGSITLMRSLLSGVAVTLKPMSTRSGYFWIRSKSLLTAAFLVKILTVHPGSFSTASRHRLPRSCSCASGDQASTIVDMTDQSSIINDYKDKIETVEITQVKYWITVHEGDDDQEMMKLFSWTDIVLPLSTR